MGGFLGSQRHLELFRRPKKMKKNNNQISLLNIFCFENLEKFPKLPRGLIDSETDHILSSFQ